MTVRKTKVATKKDTKKSDTSTDTKKPVTFLPVEYLRSVPSFQSDYEFRNFFLEKYPTPARQLTAVLEKITELRNQMSNNPEKGYEIQKSLEIMETWFKSVDNPEKILANYENEESEYWSQVLGRDAAIEIISIGKTTAATMAKMSLLPLEDFEESVRICIKFAELIRDTTERVEKELIEVQANVVKT